MQSFFALFQRGDLARHVAWTVLLLVATLFNLSPACLFAGQFNRVMNLGDSLPSWNDLEGVDGKKHTSSDVADAKFLVVAFTCNSCPYAIDVEDRLIALTKYARQAGGKVIAINVNTIDEDALPAMKDKAKAKGFDFAYLYDPSQKIAHAFGATRTPEFFVFDGSRKLVYMGSLDDSPDGTAVKNRYVQSAIDAVLTSKKPDVSETVPIGCRIRFARASRQSRPAK